MSKDSLSDDAPRENGEFEELLSLAQAGDSHAVGILVEQYRNYLLLVANDALGPNLKTKVAASDLVQQSLLDVNQNIASFRGSTEREFRAWIRRILQNDVSNARRQFSSQRRKLTREVTLNDSQCAAPEPVAAENTPRTEALLREKAAALENAMQSLPERYRTVLQLRNWDELTFQEIGRQMNMTDDAARKLWARAVLKLQQTINHQFPSLQSGTMEIE